MVCLAQLREAQAERWRAGELGLKLEFVSKVCGLPKVARQPLPHANLSASLKTNPLLDFPGGWEIPWAEKPGGLVHWVVKELDTTGGLGSRICLAVQGTRVQSLFWEDSTCSCD